MELNLKPCPFCGGRAFPIVRKGEKYKAVFVECEDCGANIPIAEHKIYSHMRPAYGKSITERLVESNIFGIEDSWNTRVVLEEEYDQ